MYQPTYKSSAKNATAHASYWHVDSTGNWASKGWLLAGGLGPENVREAISIARPTAVDVSSGVCGPDGASDGPASPGFMHHARFILVGIEYKLLSHWSICHCQDCGKTP